MRFYVSSGFSAIPGMVHIAQAAERADVDGLSIPDHVFFPTRSNTPYPYTADGSLPFSVEETCWGDPWVMIAGLGAATTKLRFLTHVYILPLRHPLLVAQGASTAACFAPGRVTLGMGVGWQREEFEVLGSPFERRGRRADECIDILREIWSTGRLHARDAVGLSLPELTMNPVPPEPIPVLVGGESDAARNRAARKGDGFMSLPHSFDDLLAVIGDVRRRVSELGRDVSSFLINARCSEAWDLAGFHRLADAGVTSVNVSLWPLGATMAEKLAKIDQFQEEILGPFRDRHPPE